ncbi:MAG: hypothetical protein OEV66_09855 [Spirochaetia bacterium]|nr:hypothetical protein [Spirochaetia bacterium]
MTSITIRNIPDDVYSKIKLLSDIEKRSINNELLVIIEKGTNVLVGNNINSGKQLSKTSQIQLWRNLSGVWQDDRTTDEIINDIYSNRTMGREVDL